jgi:hypothetical protein
MTLLDLVVTSVIIGLIAVAAVGVLIQGVLTFCELRDL